MAYVKTIWVNGTTSANATNMNKIEDGIYQNANDIASLDTDKAPKTSPAFTGTPTVPTATAGDSSQQIANTAFVSNAIANKYINITTDTEFETGRIIDTKKEYGKIINVGTFASGGRSLTKTTGLTNVTYTDLKGKLADSSNMFPINCSRNNPYNISAYITSNTITVEIDTDRIGYTAIVEITYTKN